jgi:hypothetical protein
VAGNVIGPPSDEFGKGRLRIEALGESGQAGVILRRVDAAITAVPRPALASSPSAWRPCRPADATGRPRRRGVRSKYGRPWPVGGGGRESASRRVPPACGIRGGPNESVESNPESNGVS